MENCFCDHFFLPFSMVPEAVGEFFAFYLFHFAVGGGGFFLLVWNSGGLGDEESPPPRCQGLQDSCYIYPFLLGSGGSRRLILIDEAWTILRLPNPQESQTGDPDVGFSRFFLSRYFLVGLSRSRKIWGIWSDVWSAAESSAKWNMDIMPGFWEA